MKPTKLNVTMIVLVLAWIGLSNWFSGLNPYHGLIVIPFWWLLTLISDRFLQKRLQHQPERFPLHYMGITFIRLFVGAVVILIYGLVGREDLLSFALANVAAYLAFLAVETVTLLQHGRQ